MSEMLQWECPECGSVQRDPNDFRNTVCRNNHPVMLGHDTGNGWQRAYREPPSEYVSRAVPGKDHGA